MHDGLTKRLALWATCLLLPQLLSAARLNTSWLVPAGRVRVDYKGLAAPEMKICALTFDDGPDGVCTPAVATILAEHKIHGTFFVIGNRLEQYPKTLQMLASQGNEIGNHS